MVVADLLKHVTWLAQSSYGDSPLPNCPLDLQEVLRAANGFILFRGGLHVRGACSDPSWHSLQYVWDGDAAMSKLFVNVDRMDVPFAQDCMGDQFLLRGDAVARLSAEDGAVNGLGISLGEFFDACLNDPEGFLSFSLARALEPGQVLFAYPPFVFRSDKPPSLGAVPALDALHAHADIARQIQDLPDGASIRFSVEP